LVSLVVVGSQNSTGHDGPPSARSRRRYGVSLAATAGNDSVLLSYSRKNPTSRWGTVDLTVFPA
jgi:hypothetical protein